MDKLVSVIVPCYNSADCIVITLDSVAHQTYRSLECIIVDDGSSDNTCQLVQEYCNKDRRFKLVTQSHQGPSVARNTAIANSMGFFILPLDSDDLISDTFIEKAIGCFETDPDVKLVYSKADEIGGNQSFVKKIPEYQYKDFLFHNCIYNTAMYRRSDFDATCGYNPNMKFGLEDWDLWLSLLDENSKVVQIDQVLFHYRRSDALSRSHVLGRSKEYRNESLKQIYRNHPDKYADYLDMIVLLKVENDSYRHRMEKIHSNRVSEALFKLAKKIRLI